MNKIVLPSVAAFLILVIAFSSFSPVAAAAARITVTPFLEVVTIAEDDQVRNTGVMVLGVAAPSGLGNIGRATRWITSPAWTDEPYDYLAQYKLLITLNGQTVSTTGITITCNVAEKDKVYLAKQTVKTPGTRQFKNENMKTSLADVHQYFSCKPRWKPGGLSVGVLDIYFIGDEDIKRQFIADHIVVVHVTYKVGAQTFYGTEIQDLCILAWGMQPSYVTAQGGTGVMKVTKSTTYSDFHYTFIDALGDFVSCEEAAMWQREFLKQSWFG